MKIALQNIGIVIGAFVAAFLITTPIFSYFGPMRLGSEVNFQGKYGYLNQDCKLVIPAQFEQAFPFHEGLAAVSIGSFGNEKFGFIDHNGKFAIEANYGYAHSFSEGLANVIKDGKECFINRLGKILIPKKFDSAAALSKEMWSPFSDGLAEVAIDDTIGFVDHAGNCVFKIPSGWIVLGFSQGLAPVCVNKDKLDRWGFIDKRGKIVIQPVFSQIWSHAEPDCPVQTSFSDGLAGVCIGDFFTSNHKWGFIDKNGHYIVEPQFKEVRSFQDGLAPVCTGNLRDGWGYINKQGQMIIKPIYGFADQFCEGLAAVNVGGNISKQGLWGFIDKNGHWVISPQFDNAGSFSEGLAEVRIRKSSLLDSSDGRGLIDRTGKWHCNVPEEINGLNVQTDILGTRFSEGLTPVKIGKWVYNSGKEVEPIRLTGQMLLVRQPWIVLVIILCMWLILSASALGGIRLYKWIQYKRPD